jgi:NADPH:quinone reductase-like Zn-dependent oxidoreductase
VTAREVHAIGVAAPGRPEIFTHEEPEPAFGELWLRTEWSGISAGTEVSLVRGTDPHHAVGWNPEQRSFGAAGRRADYPIRGLGYMEVARVVESRSASVPEGGLVAMAYGHQTGRCATGDEALLPVPDDLDPRLGIYLAQMGPICVNGLLHAAATLAGLGADIAAGVRGRNVLITGAGVVGLFTALLAVQHGAADVLVAEPSTERRAVAEALGLVAVDDSEGAAWQCVKQRWRHGPGDYGADVALQCRGQDLSLATALKSLRPQGVVVDLAFYQGGAPNTRLGEEFHHNGLAIVCAQIARVPRGMAATWSRAALSNVALDLLRDRGPDLLHHVVTDVVPFADGPAFLADLAARRRHSVQAILRFEPRD